MLWTISLHNSCPSRVNHSAVVVDGKIYSFGGYTSDEPLPVIIDVHVFSTDTLSWHRVFLNDMMNAPPGLYGHSVVAYGRKVYLWGGQGGLSPTNTIYCFDVDAVKWSKPATTGQVPEPADGHSACVIGDYMYIFGGYEDRRFGRDVYRINLLTFHWERVITEGVPPDSRDFHTASAIGERMYIFGGRSCLNDNELEEEYYTNQIMYLNTTNKTWVKPICLGTSPCGRRSHTASVYENEIYVIGGYESITERHLNDVHKFNPDSNMWTEMKVRGLGPSPRRRHCACVVNDQLYLFGGSSPNQRRREYSFIRFFDSNEHELVEHCDLHVLEFFASLKRLAQLVVIRNARSLDLSTLPPTLRRELHCML